jgi:LuxR family quorum sensing-dependent transcriptional regulator
MPAVLWNAFCSDMRRVGTGEDRQGIGAMMSCTNGGGLDGLALVDPLGSFEALFRRLVLCDDQDEVESVVGRLARVLGFDYFSYVISVLPAADENRSTSGMLLTSYPADWRNRYRRRSYEIEDPVIVKGRHELLPFAWGDDGYLKQIAPSSRRLFFEARDFGILNGFTVPVHGPHHECALFSVAGPEPRIGAQDVSSPSYRALLVVAQYLHANVMGRRLERQVAASPVKLTDHERVCLIWTSRGKTAWEIAQIIGRSKATVDFHIRRAAGKLNATNKIHAAFRALQLNLL